MEYRKPWTGLKALLQGTTRRVYIIAAQCYGYYFAEALAGMNFSNNIIASGLSAGFTHSVGTDNYRQAWHYELSNCLKLISFFESLL